MILLNQFFKNITSHIFMVWKEGNCWFDIGGAWGEFMRVAFPLFFGSKTQMASLWETRTFLHHCLPCFGVQSPEAIEKLEMVFLSFLSLNTLFITIFATGTSIVSYIYGSISNLFFHQSIQYTWLICWLCFSIFVAV